MTRVRRSASRAVGRRRPTVNGPAADRTASELMAEAAKARRTAYAPYSKFRVGAAILARDGRVFHGCNVENASFGLTICAERNAVWKAVSEGVRDFVAIAVTANPRHGASPCGACRQVLHEFAPELRVLWNEGSRIVERPLAELLAEPFRLAPKRKP